MMYNMSWFHKTNLFFPFAVPYWFCGSYYSVLDGKIILKMYLNSCSRLNCGGVVFCFVVGFYLVGSLVFLWDVTTIRKSWMLFCICLNRSLRNYSETCLVQCFKGTTLDGTHTEVKSCSFYTISSFISKLLKGELFSSLIVHSSLVSSCSSACLSSSLPSSFSRNLHNRLF